MDPITTIVAVLVGLIAGAVTAYVFIRHTQNIKKKHAVEESDRIIIDAEKKAESIKKEAQLSARELELKAKGQEKDAKERKSELQKMEERILKKEESIEKKGDLLSQKESDISKRERSIGAKEKEIDDKVAEQEALVAETRETLQRVASMSQEEARRRLYTSLIDEVKHDSAKEIRAIEDEAKAEAEKRAKRIIATSIMRYAGEYSAEKTVSVVNLPNDDMKGRIIGREGRNIRAFEAATGIDLIIDDTPEAVILSGYNPVRREIARISLEKLINDGRIHPSRIEEIVNKTKKEVDAAIKEAGESAIFDLGLHGLHPELIKLVGRLKYRTSYAQNILTHAIEVGFLTGMMCAELGLNVRLGRRAGLLHDIGKAVDHKVEGPHALIGANLARKYNEPPEVVHAIAAHHEEEKPSTVLAFLVAASDAISGARPGARREMLESYIQRIQELENISTSFSGVEKAFAVQAGRELRILVESNKITDDQSVILSHDIAKMIEEKLTYPGQIKVTVIREMRAISYAK